MKKQAVSVRFDASDLKKAEKLEIDLPEMLRQALKQEINKRSERCVTCGQPLEPKAKKV